MGTRSARLQPERQAVGIQAYTIDKLVADVVGLIDAAGQQKATVIGHDWGAIIAWWLGATYPHRLHRLVCLNVPHYAVMFRFLRRSPRQLLHSWYAGFFQIPWLPEWLTQRGNWWLMTRVLQRTSRPGTFSDADLALSGRHGRRPVQPAIRLSER